MVNLIAEEAGVKPEAVWINVPKSAEEKVQVYFWTAKMTNKEFNRLASTGAAGYRGKHGGGVTRRLP
jgi:hypothetical protein